MIRENFIDEEFLLLERPNIRSECHITSDLEMQNYLALYNTYSNLLIQFMIKKYYLKEVDKELEKRSDSFPPTDDLNKDLYQHLSIGYLKYFYIRNNIYIERLNQDGINYLFSIYNSGDFTLTTEKEQFINDTYLNVILENKDRNHNINYGPDSFKYYKPCNAIIIGVRYNQFSKLQDNERTFDDFAIIDGKVDILTSFLEYKIKNESSIPFNVIKYDEFSVNIKKKIVNISKKE